MRLLVPNPLREAASALGLPRSLVIRRIAYRAARAGLITGVLLGHGTGGRRRPAPLLFTRFPTSLQPRLTKRWRTCR